MVASTTTDIEHMVIPKYGQTKVLFYTTSLPRYERNPQKLQMKENYGTWKMLLNVLYKVLKLSIET